MKLVLLALAGALVMHTTAFADEVDFYIFKTEHNDTANKTAKFKTYVRRTNLVNYRVDDQDEYKCVVQPATPDQYRCKLKTGEVVLRDTEASARSVLTGQYKLVDADIKELKKVQPGIYQAIMKNDDIYHVTMEAPKVYDDSMECVVSVVRKKSVAHFACNSEFHSDSAFTVRDVPIKSVTGNAYVFGVEAYYDYRYTPDAEKKAKYDEDNKDAIAKARAVVDGMTRLKKWAQLAAGKTIYNFSLNLDETSYYARLEWAAGRYEHDSVSEFKIDGEVKHLNHDNLRRGD